MTYYQIKDRQSPESVATIRRLLAALAVVPLFVTIIVWQRDLIVLFSPSDDTDAHSATRKRCSTPVLVGSSRARVRRVADREG